LIVNKFRRRKLSLPSGLIFCVIMLHSVVLAFSQRPDGPLISLIECWRNDSIRLDPVTPAYDVNGLYLPERGGRLSAVAIQNGKLIWSTELGGEIRSNVAVIGGSVYVVAGPAADGKPNGTGSLRVLSANTGVPTVEIQVSTEEARLIPAAGKLVVLTPGGLISAFETGGHALAWQRSLPQINIKNALVRNDRLVIATADKKVHVIAAATGADLSVVPTERPVSALGVIEDDIVWGDDHGEIVRYDLEKNSVYWRFKNGARISGFAPTDDGIAAASLDNFTYFLSSDYGSVRWKKRLPGRVESITPFGKTLVVVQTVGEPTATLISVENGRSVGQVSSQDDSFTEPPLDAHGSLVFFTNQMIFAERATPCASK